VAQHDLTRREELSAQPGAPVLVIAGRLQAADRGHDLVDLWGVGAVFFGLWLIPMGRCVLSSGWMPRPLGWILVVGGLGYVISAFVGYLVPDAHGLADVLTVPATVGEFWMLGYLLTRGVRRQAVGEDPGEPFGEAPVTAVSATSR
jgi:hypothetical protein